MAQRKGKRKGNESKETTNRKGNKVKRLSGRWKEGKKCWMKVNKS